MLSLFLSIVLSSSQCVGSPQQIKQVEDFANKNIPKILGNIKEPFKSFTELNIKDIVFVEEGNTAIVVCELVVINKSLATLFVVLTKFNGSLMISNFSMRDQGLLKYMKSM